jgi:hypothetical protein
LDGEIVSDRSSIGSADSKRKLLLKIKALADRGVGGEQINAAAFLEKLLRDHGLEENDLIGDVVKDHEFKFDGRIHFAARLLEQIAYAVTGNIDDRKYTCKYVQRTKSRRCIVCTDSEFVEIAAMYEFYVHHLKIDIEMFYGAFIQSNNIFPLDGLRKPREDADRPNTDEEMKRLRLSRHLDTHIYRRQIAGGGDADV